jgi:hypothetical protein
MQNALRYKQMHLGAEPRKAYMHIRKEDFFLSLYKQHSNSMIQMKKGFFF